MADAVTIAVMAKAPIAGLAKTRLIPALGATGAAALAARFIEHTVRTACAAALGPVTLWTSPDDSHPLFQTLYRQSGVTLARQPDGDLGERMLAAVAAGPGAALVIGTDCPALTVTHLRAAAAALRRHDAVLIPTDDGGYVLIGMRAPQPALFSDMAWSTSSVMQETRQRLRANALAWHELDTLWDVDTPADLDRLRREHPQLLG